MMTAEALLDHAGQHQAPPAHLNELTLALWYAAHGDWQRAHEIAQDIPSREGSWVHAWLHLQEGDAGNAAYWFHRAGRPVRSAAELDALWLEITEHCLTQDL